jgi:hypothetical protein
VTLSHYRDRHTHTEEAGAALAHPEQGSEAAGLCKGQQRHLYFAQKSAQEEACQFHVQRGETHCEQRDYVCSYNSGIIHQILDKLCFLARFISSLTFYLKKNIQII